MRFFFYEADWSSEASCKKIEPSLMLQEAVGVLSFWWENEFASALFRKGFWALDV